MVTDLAEVLSADENIRLTRMLADYEQQTRHQIVILTVDSLSGESIEEFSIRVANTWGIGRADVDNGILIVLAPQEREVRISLGFGFERHISDAQADEIIQTQMIPCFRILQYAKGLELGVEQLMKYGRSFVVPESAVEATGEPGR